MTHPDPALSPIPPTSAKSPEYQAMVELISRHAQQAQGNAQDLLKLLRCLEQMHRQIRDTAFQDALPTNRQALYALLREIETEGGWPYIPRMQLNTYLKKVAEAEASGLPPESSEPPGASSRN